MLAILMSGVALFISWRKGYGRADHLKREDSRAPLSPPHLRWPSVDRGRRIYSGWMTPTEVAAFVCVYTLALECSGGLCRCGPV